MKSFLFSVFANSSFLATAKNIITWLIGDFDSLLMSLLVLLLLNFLCAIVVAKHNSIAIRPIIKNHSLSFILSIAVVIVIKCLSHILNEIDLRTPCITVLAFANARDIIKNAIDHSGVETPPIIIKIINLIIGRKK